MELLSSGKYIRHISTGLLCWFFGKDCLPMQEMRVSLVGAMRETQVRSLGWEDPLEEGMATHSNILAWRIPMDRGAWQGYSLRGLKELDTTE